MMCEIPYAPIDVDGRARHPKHWSHKAFERALLAMMRVPRREPLPLERRELGGVTIQ